MNRSMLHPLRALALALLVLPTGSAAAQSATTTPYETDGWAPVKHLEFTDEDVTAGLTGPEGELIQVVPRVAHPSLIEIRGGFEVEVVKTMEDM
jgi:hypothetical protein